MTRVTGNSKVHGPSKLVQIISLIIRYMNAITSKYSITRYHQGIMQDLISGVFNRSWEAEVLSGRRPRIEARSAEKVGVGRAPPPQCRSRGITPRNFVLSPLQNIWILVRFLQLIFTGLGTGQSFASYSLRLGQIGLRKNYAALALILKFFQNLSCMRV